MKLINCCVRTSARLRTLRSHFLPLPFFFLLVFLLFLRPPGMMGLMAGALVGDGFGAAAVSAVAGAGASAAGAGASAVVWKNRGNKIKSISDSPAASVRLRWTIDLSAPPGLAFTRSLAALSAKQVNPQKGELAYVRH